MGKGYNKKGEWEAPGHELLEERGGMEGNI